MRLAFLQIYPAHFKTCMKHSISIIRALIIAYLALCLVQLVAIADALTMLHLNWLEACAIALWLAFMPIIGSLAAVFAGVDELGWTFPEAIGLIIMAVLLPILIWRVTRILDQTAN